ncbi:hypothetical protein HYH02_003144 [Chlamydomonas schloesseri]|uniref:Uncharacterized protein n=1 Tax=Chlamydomonas schloesseri TaxID=2026947 RepID=A0A835WR06_9CHLO|nr:hypothetical protein HYH02_003144 [Chlamydomonas schloesseri]|eukprot:KAG2452110.1 hypothetical protein HYH02_003144 [Chlamydomonas schloesseri]
MDVCWRRLLDNPVQLGRAGLDALFGTLRAQGSLGALRLASRATRGFVDANTSRLSLRLQGHRPLRPGSWAALLGRCGAVSELVVRADPSGFCKQRGAAGREPGCLLGAAFGGFPTPATARLRSLEVDVHRGRYIESGGGGGGGWAAAADGDDVPDAGGAGGRGRVRWSPATSMYESASSDEADLAVGGPAAVIAAAIATEAAVGANRNAAAAAASISSTASHVRYTSLLAFPNLTRVVLCGEWASPPQDTAARAVCAVLASLPHLRSLHLGRFTASGLQQLAAAASSSTGRSGKGGGAAAATAATPVGAAANCQQLAELTLGEAESADGSTTAGTAAGRDNAMDAALTEAAAAALAALGRLERLRVYGVAPGGPAMRALLAHGLAPNLQRLELCRTVAAGGGGGGGRGTGPARGGNASGSGDNGRGSGNAAERHGLAGGGVVGAGGVAGCWFALRAVPAAAPQQQAATATAAAAAIIPHASCSASSSALHQCDVELDCSLTDAGGAACCVSYGGLVVRHLRAVRITVKAGAPPPLAASSQPYGALRQLAGSARTCVVDCVELLLTEHQQQQSQASAGAAAGAMGARCDGYQSAGAAAAAAAAAMAAHATATADGISQVAVLLAPPRGLHVSAPDVLSPGNILGPALALDQGLAGGFREFVIWDAPALTPKMVPQLLAALWGLETLVVGRGCRQLCHNSHYYEMVAMLGSTLMLKAGKSTAAAAAEGLIGSSGGGAGAGPQQTWARVVLAAPQVSAARVAELNERLAGMNVAVRLATARHS